MAYVVVVYVVVAYTVMAYILMAYIVMALYSYGGTETTLKTVANEPDSCRAQPNMSGPAAVDVTCHGHHFFYRHRRRRVHRVGMGVPGLKMTASPRRSF